jgi:hypothetical protein
MFVARGERVGYRRYHRRHGYASPYAYYPPPYGYLQPAAYAYPPAIGDYPPPDIGYTDAPPPVAITSRPLQKATTLTLRPRTAIMPTARPRKGTDRTAGLRISR